ncbi:hypothetical protein LB553_07190 [Mesorhizobium sp. CA8]|uniref:hypothetical protein n=1 Tax=Mesorhizobium sp. CA8 TaxID=2876637 RepID=UPI001CCC4047|nr:hypothetical protein [Mesorhizobium sp. CA8]MBZ9760662.1 hypothetical protein [Mesorhizobium sp. CA8]
MEEEESRSNRWRSSSTAAPMTLPVDLAEPARRLRRVRAALSEGRPIDPEDAGPLIAAIDSQLIGGSFEAEFGLSAPGRGKRNARRALLIEERDDALRSMAEQIGTEIGDANSEGVWDVFEALQAFADYRWPALRDAATCPPELDEADALAWTILQGNGGKPPSRRWLAEFFRQ